MWKKCYFIWSTIDEIEDIRYCKEVLFLPVLVVPSHLWSDRPMAALRWRHRWHLRRSEIFWINNFNFFLGENLEIFVVFGNFFYRISKYDSYNFNVSIDQRFKWFSLFRLFILFVLNHLFWCKYRIVNKISDLNVE